MRIRLLTLTLALLALLAFAAPALAAGPKSRISFSASAYAVAENVPAGYIDIPVKRAGKTSVLSGQTVLVDYSTSSSSPNATAEYTPVKGTLTFPAGTTGGSILQTIRVPITDDNVVGGPVVVNLQLRNARVQGGGRATLTYPSSAVLAISEADTGSGGGGGGGGGGTPAPTFQLALASDSVGELSGPATAYVIRSGDLTQAASVNYATANGSASAGTDYTSTSGTLNFPTQASDPTNSIIQQVNIPILHNTSLSAPATSDFFVNLSNPSTGAQLGSPAQEDITIVNQDGTPTVQFSTANFPVAENGGYAHIPVYVVGSIPTELDVNYATADGSAIAGTNYTAVSDQLQFMPGDTVQYIDVPVLDDGVFGDSSSFTTTLSSPTAGSLGSPSSNTVSIQDSDPQPTASLGPITITRDGSGNVVVSGTVLLSGQSAQDTPVSLTLSDPASGRTLGTVNVTVPARQTSVPFSYTIPADQLGGAQTIVVTIGGASGATVIPGDPGTASTPTSVPPSLQSTPSNPNPSGSQTAAADKVAPKLTLSARKIQKAIKSKVLLLSAKCSENCKLAVVATMKVKVVKNAGKAVKTRTKAISLGKASAKTAGGKVVKIKVKLSKKALATLAKYLKGGKANVTISVVAADAAGNKAKANRAVTVKR